MINVEVVLVVLVVIVVVVVAVVAVEAVVIGLEQGGGEILLMEMRHQRAKKWRQGVLASRRTR